MSTNQRPPKRIMVHISARNVFDPINLLFSGFDENSREQYIFRYQLEIPTTKRISMWKRAFQKRPAPRILPEAIVSAHDLIVGMYSPGDSVYLFIDSFDQSALAAISMLVEALATGTSLAGGLPSMPSNNTQDTLQKIPTELLVASGNIRLTGIDESDVGFWNENIHECLPAARHTIAIDCDPDAFRLLGLYSLRNSQSQIELKEVWNLEIESGELNGYNSTLRMSQYWLMHITNTIIDYNPSWLKAGSIFQTDPTWIHVVNPSHVLDYDPMTPPSPSFVANRYHLRGYEATHPLDGKCRWLKWSAIYKS